MIIKKIIDANLDTAKAWAGAESLDEGLVLTDRIVDNPVRDPQRVNFILMGLCQQGEAHYSIDTRQQTVKPGDLFFVSERHIVDNYQASPDFQCLNIMLSTEFYHSFVLNVKNVSSLLLFSTKNPVVTLTSDECQTYATYYRAIRNKIAAKSHPFRTELVKALLLAMFYDMSGVIWRVEQQGNRGQTRADAFFAQFIKLLEANFRSERRVGWYARQLGISPKYLAEVVKQVSKRTPNDWIDHYVVLELRVLLKNSTKTIKEITEELQFPNQSFLGKYFKEHVGMSPSDYRRQ
ncbi:MAG: AraC family transcriptional regulator [Prevotella sp.]|nr:AraC family transcriptional regulator [Prevotella sp.]